MGTLLIRAGRVIDPSQGIDRTADLFIRDDRVVGIDVETPQADRVLDAAGRIVCPGLIDLHVWLGEPGFEEDETTATGTAAALAGGVTGVVCTPDTSPVVDNRAAAEFVLLQAERAGFSRVFPLGAVTKDHAGRELAELGQLVEGGAVGFTDAKRPVHSAEIMRRALEYARMFDRPVFAHPQVPELVAGGVMHEGLYSTLLGLRGMPAASEAIQVNRDVALAELTAGRLHVMSVTTSGAIDRIRRAREQGIRVTADVTPHHLLLDDECLRSFDPNYKVDPPLRTAEHRETLLQALEDGTIDAISSDHRPCAPEKKQRELDLAPFGIVGLETLLPLCIRALIEPGHLTWLELVEKLSTGPARVLGLEEFGSLRPGSIADVTVIDPEVPWTIDPERFRSRSRNTPFAGWKVRGRAVATIVGGEVRYTLEG